MGTGTNLFRRWSPASALLWILFVSAVAQAQPAALAKDGRALAGETMATQVMFTSVWGERAAQRWVDEHNAELAGLHATTSSPDVSPESATLPSRTADGATVTPIAYQSFQHGFMLWRKDNGQMTVGYTEIRTKTGAACQETYQDTYRDQAYDLPPAPVGLFAPTLGFGWLFHNDKQLADHLGYASATEVSRVAEIRSRQSDTGEQTLELKLSDDIPGVANPLVVGRSDEPGLTYCFPRGDENRAVLNTWMAIQRFDHGLMRWRQDRPDRVEVIHYDTQWAPVANCVDTFDDTWAPGEVLDYGRLAQGGRLLPERGFGKVWLATAYVRDSLGYPKETEQGGFAEVVFAPIHHPIFGAGEGRRTTLHLASGELYKVVTIFPGGKDPDRETRTSQACQRLLVPHAS